MRVRLHRCHRIGHRRPCKGHKASDLYRMQTPVLSGTGRDGGTIFEVHVIRAFRISASSKPESAVVHQNEIRRANDAKQIPAFLQESIHDWPV
jgi:hypothetical protein